MGSELRFQFGKNWASFSQYLTEEKLEEARRSLQRLFDVERLDGKSFLDIGCGSGLFSIAATQLGAYPVVGIDIDEDSIRTSQENARRWAPEAEIVFRQASVLNEAEMQALGTFDIVYSWGVLHHTGDMQRALELASRRVKPGGTFVVAIYNRHWSSWGWKLIKRMYNYMPAGGQKVMVWSFAPLIFAAKAIVTRGNPLRERRGMDFYHNLIDWLGGYPYEYASVEEMVRGLEELGMQVERVFPAPVPTGCNEFRCVLPMEEAEA